jgi:uncharacterized protein (DUF3084 family)
MSKQSDEQLLLDQIVVANKDVLMAQQKMVKLRQQYWDAETELMGFKMAKEDLEQQLKVVRNCSVDYEQTPEEKDIAEFAERLPELLKKV